MKTVEEAHAAGKRDGEQGLGAVAPRNGPPGSQAHRLHSAYMQSYRDALVARVGIPERRRRNPKKKKSKSRARYLPAPRAKVVTTVSQSKVIRTTNRRALHVLYATKRGHPRLKYLGRGKFGTRGGAVLFRSAAEGNLVGRVMADAFPQIMRGWTLRAGAPDKRKPKK